MAQIALYPGTFDPLTFGHLDMVVRASTLSSKLIVGIAENPGKNPLFSLEQRKRFVEIEINTMKDKGVIPESVEVQAFTGLLTDFAKCVNASMLIRGLRAVSDFEYEFKLATMNRSLAPDIESIFLTPKESLIYVSSSLIKEICDLKGDISKFVHPSVEQALKAKLDS